MNEVSHSDFESTVGKILQRGVELELEGEEVRMVCVLFTKNLTELDTVFSLGIAPDGLPGVLSALSLYAKLNCRQQDVEDQV